MEPSLSLPGASGLAYTSGYPNNGLKVTERENLRSNFDTGLNKVVKYTDITKLQTKGRHGSNTSQFGNVASDTTSSLTEPEKRPRRTYFLPPTLIENTNDKQQMDPLQDLTDPMFMASAKTNNNVSEKSSAAKRRPLHLPLPRRISCKFTGSPDQSKSGGKPIWNVSSRITTRSTSVSGASLSPVKPLRSSTVPKKPSVLEVSVN